MSVICHRTGELLVNLYFTFDGQAASTVLKGVEYSQFLGLLLSYLLAVCRQVNLCTKNQSPFKIKKCFDPRHLLLQKSTSRGFLDAPCCFNKQKALLFSTLMAVL